MCSRPKIPTPEPPPVVQPAPVLNQAAPDAPRSKANTAQKSAEGTKRYRVRSSLSIGKGKSGVNTGL